MVPDKLSFRPGEMFTRDTIEEPANERHVKVRDEACFLVSEYVARSSKCSTRVVIEW